MADSTLTSAPQCEVVKWHTRQKHEFIRQYLSVWTNRVAKSGRNTPKLSLVDLFASYGWCRSDPKVEPGVQREPWPGSAILAARALVAYPRPQALVLNSFNPSSASETAAQSGALTANLLAEVGPNPPFRVERLSEPVMGAARKAATFVDLNYPSVWMLDPYYPESLPWTVVEYVANLKRDYHTSGGTASRRPELLITFITEGLQRNVDVNPRTIDLALGMQRAAWQGRLAKLRASGANVREGLISIFAENLHAIYGKPPTVIEVDGSPGNIVYAILLCSSHDAGTFVPKILVKPEFQAWRVSNWKPTARLITKNRTIRRTSGAKAPIQRSLDEPLGSRSSQATDATSGNSS